MSNRNSHQLNSNQPSRLIRWALIGLIALTAVMAAPQPGLAADDEGGAAAMTFTPEISLPGQFEGDIDVDESLAAKYIRAIYIYLVWAIGIIAAVMITYGGVKWVAAAGNPTSIKDAKDIITNAVIAIIIALTTVLLLNLINPDLLKLNLAKLNSVKGIVLTGGSYYADGDCYQELSCPAGYQQVVGGYCDPLSGVGYAPPGTDPCGYNIVYSLCCQNTSDPKMCYGFSARDKKMISGTGKCHDIPAASWSKTICSDKTACGSYNKTNSCVGGYCANGACELSSVSESGKCWPADGAYKPDACESNKVVTKNDFMVPFSSNIKCGEYDTYNGSWFAGTSGCSTGHHCLINQPNRTSGEKIAGDGDANHYWCNYPTKAGVSVSNPTANPFDPPVTYCSP